jgi:hypothetical protein
MLKSKMDTVVLTQAKMASLIIPGFQRPLRVNDKVKAIAERMKHNGGVIDGVITIGKLKGVEYLIDGQHRREAFMISELPEAYCDVRIIDFANMAEMAEEFVRLNSCIVRMRPDDVLRGMEPEVKALEYIRTTCPFVGYGQIRRTKVSPLMSMSMVLRTWKGARSEGAGGHGGSSAAQLAREVTMQQAKDMCEFLNCCKEAWGDDREYVRLFSALNLTICAWLYIRVVQEPKPGTKRSSMLTPEQFTAGLMGLSASKNHLDWLVGRDATERDRPAAYRRIKQIMQRRIEQDLGKRITLPQPSWV